MTEKTASILCLMCHQELKTKNLNISPYELAKKNNWTKITLENSHLISGFMCKKCHKKIFKGI